MGDDGRSLELGDAPTSKDFRVFARDTPVVSLQDKLATKFRHDFLGLHMS